MKEIMERARAMGANAILGIDIHYFTIGANVDTQGGHKRNSCCHINRK